MANEQMEITSPELERLLLHEPTAEEQLSSMRATLAEMANAVKTLAQQNVSQVRQIVQTLSGHLVSLENMPATVLEDLDQGSTRAATKMVTTMAHSVREQVLLECGAKSVELYNEKKIEKYQTALSELLSVKFSSLLRSVLTGTERDEACMRELEELLDVEAEEVVHKIRFLLSGTRQNERAILKLRSIQVTSCPDLATTLTKQVDIQQMNAYVFDNVEYHASFDPTAAAQGECLRDDLVSTDLNTGLKARFQPGGTSSPRPMRMTMNTAYKAGFDLNAEEIPLTDKAAMCDASENQMTFKGAVRLTMQLQDGIKQQIAWFVMKGEDGMIVLGTNALQKLEVKLPVINEALQLAEANKTRKTPKRKSSRRNRQEGRTPIGVTVAKRMHLRPGETKLLQLRQWCSRTTSSTYVAVVTVASSADGARSAPGAETSHGQIKESPRHVPVRERNIDLGAGVLADERKEEELRKKQSSYLTPYGLALVMNAHRRRRHEYAEDVQNAKGKRLYHTPAFPQVVLYDTGAHLTTPLQCWTSWDDLDSSGLNPSNDQKVLIALLQAFCRVNAEIGYPDHVTIYLPVRGLVHPRLEAPGHPDNHDYDCSLA
ncbi:unnamed protein product [Heligmosomoides polygyrus]|uniref:Retrovirus-related Pol polyprotein from transposon TNT 1-94 n=1 Tax=Heligmosomoides polygyrus TaxID=6339 RepID=A0A183FGJ1_HELPZ|nr:unnamed protein product [Heligmosomoides polygyrus]